MECYSLCDWVVAVGLCVFSMPMAVCCYLLYRHSK